MTFNFQEDFFFNKSEKMNTNTDCKKRKRKCKTIVLDTQMSFFWKLPWFIWTRGLSKL